MTNPNRMGIPEAKFILVKVPAHDSKNQASKELLLVADTRKVVLVVRENVAFRRDPTLLD